MAISFRNLSVLNYANGFTLWHYRTRDSLCEVTSKGYFKDASDMLKDGDFILVSSVDGGKLVFVTVIDDVDVFVT